MPLAAAYSELAEYDQLKSTLYLCIRLKSWALEMEHIWLSCLGSPIITALLALYNSGSAEAMSHWLASSIITTSNMPGRNGRVPLLKAMSQPSRAEIG